MCHWKYSGLAVPLVLVQRVYEGPYGGLLEVVVSILSMNQRYEG